MERFHALIDWDAVMSAPRYAGGHIEVMRALFGENADVLGEYVENDYQGDESFAYRIKSSGEILIAIDSFGSCSGCDAWEDSTDDDARHMVHEIVQNARVFPNVACAVAWINGIDGRDEYPNCYLWRNVSNLLPSLEKL